MFQFRPLSQREYGQTGRLRNLSLTTERLSILELLILIAAGAVAATAVTFLHFPVRIPGHAILKTTIPIACGVALVTRPWAGTISGSAGMLTSSILLLFGLGHLPAAAMVPLVAIGPAIDFVLRGKKKDSGSLYLRFALVGMLANLCAYAVRWGALYLQADNWQSLNFRQMGLWALASFALCGLAAGLLCSAICFRSSLRTENPQ